MNHRKEFFRVDLKHIRDELEKRGIQPRWTMTAAAAEYRDSLAIEAKIKNDPAMRDAWVKRQLQLELLEGGRPDELPAREIHAHPLTQPAMIGK